MALGWFWAANERRQISTLSLRFGSLQTLHDRHSGCAYVHQTTISLCKERCSTKVRRPPDFADKGQIVGQAYLMSHRVISTLTTQYSFTQSLHKRNATKGLLDSPSVFFTPKVTKPSSQISSCSHNTHFHLSTTCVFVSVPHSYSALVLGLPFTIVEDPCFT